MRMFTNVTIFGMSYINGKKGVAIVPAGILEGETSWVKGSVKFGSSARDACIVPDSTSNEVRLSRDLMDGLNIYDGMEVSAKFDDGILSLGPLVGLITNSKVLKGILDARPGPKIVQAMKAARQANVLLYFFTIDGLRAEGLVSAAVYIPSTGSWQYKNMPLPDVLYDRGRAEGLSERKMIKGLKIRERLNHMKGLQKINAQHYFDKWDLHCRLSKHEEMKKYLPETVLFKDNIEDLGYMIDKYSTVYLKACLGSNGKSVMRVSKFGDSSYEYDCFKLKLIREDTDYLSNVLTAAGNYLENKKFIIQQGIDALIYRGNKVDVRVLVQKDGRGKWAITSMPVRIAVDNCPVTSTKSGSNVYKFDDAFLNLFKLEAEQVGAIKKKIYRLIDTAVSTIEKEYGTFGELGIDVAIDKNYDLWFIESNSKPAKDTIIKSGSEEDIENAFLPPYKYARYLSGFGYKS